MSFFLRISFLYLLFFFNQVLSQNYKKIKINLSDINGKFVTDKVQLQVIDVSSSKTLINQNTSSGKILIDSLPPAFYFFNLETEFFDDIKLYLQIKNDTTFTIIFNDSAFALNEVVFNEKKSNSYYIGNTYEYDAKSINLQPASFGDPSRVVQNLPGVLSADDNSNRIVVRGNSPTNTVFYLEDVEIPNSSALGGAVGGGGGISIFNENSIDKFSFYNSVYPSIYSNSNGAVFNIILKNGDHLKRKFVSKISPLGVFIGLQGYIKKGNTSTFNFNARVWDISWLKNIFGIEYLAENRQIPSFKDYTFKLSIPLTDKSILNFSSFGGTGSFYIKKNKYDTETSSYLPLVNILCLETKLSSKILIKNRFAQTFAQTSEMKESYFNSFTKNSVNLNKLNTLELKYQSTIDFQINKNINYSAGLSFIKSKSNTLYNNYLEGDFPDSFKVSHNYIVNNYFNNFKIQTFNNFKIKLKLKNEFDFGFFIGKYSVSNKVIFEPRFNYRHIFNHWLSSVLSMGKSTKLMFENTPYTKSKIMPSNAISFNYAQNIVYRKNLVMKFDFYYQALYRMYLNTSNIPYFYNVYDVSENMNTQTHQNDFNDKGLGRNYGVEYIIKHDFKDNFLLQLSGSVFKSQYKGIGTSWLNTPFDSRFNLAFSGNKTFIKVKSKSNRKIIFSFRVVDFGGFNERPLSVDSTVKYGKLIYSDSLYSQKMQNYFRFDFGFQLKYEKMKFTHDIKIDLINVTNRKNYLYTYYDNTTKSIQKVYQLPFLPVISYSLCF